VRLRRVPMADRGTHDTPVRQMQTGMVEAACWIQCDNAPVQAAHVSGDDSSNRPSIPLHYVASTLTGELSEVKDFR
jgi:hypothetical protein